MCWRLPCLRESPSQGRMAIPGREQLLLACLRGAEEIAGFGPRHRTGPFRNALSALDPLILRLNWLFAAVHEAVSGTKRPIRNVRYHVRLRGRGGHRANAQLRPELTRSGRS